MRATEYGKHNGNCWLVACDLQCATSSDFECHILLHAMFRAKMPNNINVTFGISAEAQTVCNASSIVGKKL